MIFWDSILEGFLGESPPKISGDKIAFAAQQLYTKIRFRCFVVYKKKSVQDLERKKVKKKKNSSRQKVGLVGMKEYLKTYNLCKIFFAVFRPFLNETAFYAKLPFLRQTKTKVTKPIASKFVTSMQLNNLKLQSKFHAATNRS